MKSSKIDRKCVVKNFMHGFHFFIPKYIFKVYFAINFLKYAFIGRKIEG